MRAPAKQHRAEPVEVEDIAELNQLVVAPESIRFSSVDCPESGRTPERTVDNKGVLSRAETTDMILEYYLDSW